MKIAIIGRCFDQQIAELFKGWGHVIVENPKHAQLLVFSGGEDVSPDIYGHPRCRYTQNNPNRDMDESEIYHECFDTPKVGICRGGQFLNVMSGGSMIQHVVGHAGADHDILDVQSNYIVRVNSLHHQQMIPSTEAVVIAMANCSNSKVKYQDEKFITDTEDHEDYEVLYYPHTRSLCYQPHPELDLEGEQIAYFKACIIDYLGVLV